MFQGTQPWSYGAAFLENFQVLFQCLGQARAISVIPTRCPRWCPTWRQVAPGPIFLCAGTLWCFIPCMELTRCPKELQVSCLWNFISPMSKNLFQENSSPSELLFLADEIFLLQYCIGIDCKNGVGPTNSWVALIHIGTWVRRIWATSYFFLTHWAYSHIRALH